MIWTVILQGAITLVMLTGLELVLGVDNIVMVSIISNRLPKVDQSKARKIGLILAIMARVLLLCTLSFFAGIQAPLFFIFAHGVKVQHIIFLIGGLFLLSKSTVEIHKEVEEEGETAKEIANDNRKAGVSFGWTILSIVGMDIVFSLDSVITAVGMANSIGIMIAAVVFAMIVMILMVDTISEFINQHPTVKMLALAFLLMIGALLVISSAGVEVPRGYIYFAMGFSGLVEVLNMTRAKKRKAKVISLPDSADEQLVFKPD